MTSAPPSVRLNAVENAKKVLAADPVYLDTETTGLEKSDVIIEISIVDNQGCVLFESLINPQRSIPAASTRIHGITNDDVRNAPKWQVVWPQIRSILFGRVIVAYNEAFDVRMMQQTHARNGLPWKDKFTTVDLLKLYAEFRGEWDNYRRGYRYHSLATAGQQCGILLPNAHRSTADTLLTRAVLHYIANYRA